MAWFKDIFREDIKLKEINASDKISIIGDITTLTVNADTSESSYLSDLSNTESKS